MKRTRKKILKKRSNNFNFTKRTKTRYPTLRNYLLKIVKSVKYVTSILKCLDVVFERKCRLQHSRPYPKMHGIKIHEFFFLKRI